MSDDTATTDPDTSAPPHTERSADDGGTTDSPVSPLHSLGTLAVQELAVTDTLDHLEIYTMGGLLTLLWHGRGELANVVLLGGGAMGGLLGPAGGLFHELGEALLDLGIGTIRVGYRKPNDLVRCTHDLVAAADLANRNGAQRFICGGHSFGGAVAVQGAIALGAHAAGVVTFATQSAGCENADRISGLPFLLYHGDGDELLPPMASELVALLGDGEVRMLPGEGHLLAGAGDALVDELLEWIPAAFVAHSRRDP